MKFATALLRLLAAAAIAAAIIGQLLHSLAFWESKGFSNIDFQMTNFFSFFTIESNILAVVSLALGAVFVLQGRDDSRWFGIFRVAVATYMATTGIVYNLLLRGIELEQGSTLEWSNEILHVVGPLLIVVDWLFAPGRRPHRFADVWFVVAFPIVWAVYTLVRGPFAYDVERERVWYPYPFLNPETSANGYLSVAFYVVLIALVISGIAMFLVWVSRKRATPAVAAPAS